MTCSGRDLTVPELCVVDCSVPVRNHTPIPALVFMLVTKECTNAVLLLSVFPSAEVVIPLGEPKPRIESKYSKVWTWLMWRDSRMTLAGLHY